MLRRLWQLFKGCKNGHLWFPDDSPREFLPVTVTCLRCTAQENFKPYGYCLGGHPLADHYDDDGRLKPPLEICWGPR